MSRGEPRRVCVKERPSLVDRELWRGRHACLGSSCQFAFPRMRRAATRLAACLYVLIICLAPAAAASLPPAAASARHASAAVDGSRRLQQQQQQQQLQPAARRLLTLQQQQQQQRPSSSCGLLQALRTQPTCGTFASLVSSCGLEGTLCERAGRAGVTLLAPTDTAVAEYLVRRKLSLAVLSASKPLARSILLYHIVPDPRLQQLAASAAGAGGTQPQVVVLQTAAASAPSELVAKTSSGAGLLFVDARGRAGKVLRVLTPPGASGPQLLLVDRVLSHTLDPLGAPAGPGGGMAGVTSAEESGSPRMNARASIAHAKGAIGVSRHDGVLQQQLQQP